MGILTRCPFVLYVAGGLKFLDVGAPRTGTQSMHMASEILGYRTLHTGYHQEFRFPMCNYLFNNGSLELALAVLESFDAAMDEPVHLMYEEVMTHFPESKFILTISDLEDFHLGKHMAKLPPVGCKESLPLDMFLGFFARDFSNWRTGMRTMSLSSKVWTLGACIGQNR